MKLRLFAIIAVVRCFSASALTPNEGWTNLLATPDTQHDSLMHPWTLVNGELCSPKNAPKDDLSPSGHQTFEFQIRNPPPNYDLRYRVTRNNQGFTMVFPFIYGGQPADVTVDGGPANQQPFGVRGDKSTFTIQEKRWFPPGETHEVIIEVRTDGLRVRYDNRLLVQISGPPPRGQSDRYFYPPARVTNPIIGIGVCAGDITVHSAEYRIANGDADRASAKRLPSGTPAMTPSLVKNDPPSSSPEFAPELAPLAAKYHAALAEFKAQDDSETAQLRNSYLGLLNEAEKSATAAGQINIVAAILEERKSATDGLTMSSLLPPNLPAALKNSHHAFVDALNKAIAKSAQRRQRLGEDYLRTLAMLEARAPATSDLAKQIAAEKESLIQKSTAPIAVPTASVATPGGSFKAVNGNFTDADSNGFPNGWFFTNTAWIDPRTFSKKSLPPGLFIKSVQEGNETVARLTYGTEMGYLAQMVEIPPHKREIVFKLYVRGKQPGKPDSFEAGFRFFSKDHKFIPEPQNLYPVRKTSPNAWHLFEFPCKLPVQAEFACIVVGSGQLMVGIYDCQRVEVNFR
jgi:hypothetical protein